MIPLQCYVDQKIVALHLHNLYLALPLLFYTNNMCGICGIINHNSEPVNENSLLTMMATMKHRGPDDQGTFLDGKIGLGFVRLSIIDLSPAGHQPMFSADGRYVVVFNGEIYNYIELREELKAKGYTFHTQTDTEVLLAAYTEWGEACMHRFI